MTFIAPLNPMLIEDVINRTLAEDLGRAGDITTLATIPASARARAVIAARESGVIAGSDLAIAAFRRLDQSIRFDTHIADGAFVSKGDVALAIEGPARAILSAERTALNFMGRLSGIASLTARYVEKVKHTKARIVCTRKTTPGLRAFEKHAVRCGGGFNHRFGLDDAILIKDNHIAVAGGVINALRAAKAFAGHLVKIEIEVDTLDQLDEVIREGADVVLLDNMTPAQLKDAVARVKGNMLTEASGGVTLESVAAIAESGVDMISVGALTHSARVLDLGLDIAIN
ncbi:MAG: carboxylating nicotinate-nucleotide diphosphorylase [Alphaproteobacteria bacterium]|jgi:nicotinate-nucleotide pyrophosphorylase (carboxylating)|nr:carboxylating nicotinate-nucleotide diphosphorylase [Alphaproteobacteria bacterium]